MGTERLDKIISSQYNISRKDVKSAIRKGLAEVNGTVVRDSGMLINPDTDKIIFDGKILNYKKYIYILMNKPKGILSASQDKKRKTVVDLVPENLCRNDLFPVGRLDRDTTGLLIITNDGELAHKAISPKKNVYKTYYVKLDGNVTDDMVTLFEKGVVLADGTLCRPAYLKPLGGTDAEIRICEGKYHQIKRMFGVVGLGVKELSRIAMGGLELPPDLPCGSCRELTNIEINRLFV